MYKIRVKTDGNEIRIFKQIALAISCFLILFPIFIIFVVEPKLNLFNYVSFFQKMLVLGFAMFTIFLVITMLFSRDSPIKSFQIRKKLILFTRQFTKTTCDGFFKHSVEWGYTFKDKKLIVELYSNGLVSDKDTLGRELSEYMRLRLLKFEELDDKARYTFGHSPQRLDGKKVLKNAKV